VSKRTNIGLAATIGTGLLYGCSFVFTKGVTNTIDPFTLLGWRFVTALVAMLILMAMRVIRVHVTRATIGTLLLLAVFQPLVYYICETYGVKRTTASESGLIIASIPVAIVLAGMVVVRTRPSRWQVAGIAITLVGVVATVAAGGLTAAFDLGGYALLIGAVVSYALYAAFAERFATATSDIDKTFVMVACGALFFGGITVVRHAFEGTLVTLVTLPAARPDFAIAVAYLALGATIGAFFLQNVGIARLGSTRYSTFIGLGTIVTLVTSALFLHERLSLAQLAGGVVILVGVYVANRRAAVNAGRSRPQGPALTSADPAT